MTDFTKIRWAGSDCILVTTRDNHNPRLPILLLDKWDIKRLNETWEEIPNQNPELKDLKSIKENHIKSEFYDICKNCGEEYPFKTDECRKSRRKRNEK